MPFSSPEGDGNNVTGGRKYPLKSKSHTRNVLFSVHEVWTTRGWLIFLNGFQRVKEKMVHFVYMAEEQPFSSGLKRLLSCQV
jgi:hypothetical protein